VICNGQKLCCEKNEFVVTGSPGYICTTCKKVVYTHGINAKGEHCGVLIA